MKDEAEICAQIGGASGRRFTPRKVTSVGGGSINSAYIIEDGIRRYFVKQNKKDLHEMFIAEAEGLNEIISANAIRAPRPLCTGKTSNSSFIVLDYISFGPGIAVSSTLLGENIAQLHRKTHSDFGWHRNNTIGSTLQVNQYQREWILFFGENRLAYQLTLAERNGAKESLVNNGQKLLSGLHYFFRDYRPVPSLLHGDLWSGNYAFDNKGDPVIFDPAVYFGDRECDIAMTELFGGFDRNFYDAYNDRYPLDAGYKTRKNLYNLYHVINHFNLFGGGYQHQAEHMINQLLSELK